MTTQSADYSGNTRVTRVRNIVDGLVSYTGYIWHLLAVYIIIVRSFNFTTKPALTNRDCGIKFNLVIVKELYNLYTFVFSNGVFTISHDLTNNRKGADRAVSQ